MSGALRVGRRRWRSPVGRIVRIAILLVVICCSACASGPRFPQRPMESAAAPGALVSVEHLDSCRHLTLRALLYWQGLADRFPTERGISLYRVRYRMLGTDGRATIASGLLALPAGDRPYRGIVSWQHGTASLRSAAPSNLDVYNGLLPAVVFAGHGYVVLAPDYLGFGASSEPHAYYHEPSISDAVVSMLRATRTALRGAGIPLPRALFLAGFSQGGHASLVAARRLEARPIEGLELRGTASLAGPIDLAGVGFPRSLDGRSRFASLYVAWVATTYARVYGEPLTSVLQPAWAQRAAPLFDGEHDADAVVAALPATPRTMMSESVLAALEDGADHWFVNRLRENSPLDWCPKSPVRVYFGSADVDVPHADAIRFADPTRCADSDVVATDLGPVDHDASVLTAAPRIVAWFDDLSAADASSVETACNRGRETGFRTTNDAGCRTLRTAPRW